MTDMEALKEWLDSEIVRLDKEGRSIENSKYVRESACHKKHSYQDVRSQLKKILSKYNLV